MNSDQARAIEIANTVRPLKNPGKLKNLPILHRFYLRLCFTIGECWLWRGFVNEDGYGKLGALSAHRLAWHLHYGPIPNGMQVLHKCDVRCCVNPDHLFLGTQRENIKDMVEKNRQWRPKNHRNPNAKLCLADAELIRQSSADPKYLAQFFNVGLSTIYRILNKKSWVKNE